VEHTIIEGMGDYTGDGNEVFPALLRTGTQTACEAYHIFPGLGASSSEDIISWIEELVFNSPIFSSGPTTDEGDEMDVAGAKDATTSSNDVGPKLPGAKRRRAKTPGTSENLLICSLLISVYLYASHDPNGLGHEAN
jgi:hypothetical protein